MQGETGSLRDLKRYHYRDSHSVLNHSSNNTNNKIIEEENSGECGDTNDNTDQESDHSVDAESEHDQEQQSNNPDHIARLREFQFKILSSSNNPICNPSQPRSGRRHTLCLTR